MVSYHALAGLAMLALVPTAARANQPIYELCYDDNVANAVVGEISAWAKGLPFARVIIGDEGQNGRVTNQQLTWYTKTIAMCHGRYDLQRSAKDGHHYTVTIDPVVFNVEDLGSAYQVTIPEMPLSLESPFRTSAQILGPFYIDGRPYAQILAENERRMQMRSRRVGR